MKNVTVTARPPLTPERPATVEYSCSLSSLGYTSTLARHGGIWALVFLFENSGKILHRLNFDPLECLCNTHELSLTRLREISLQEYDLTSFFSCGQDFAG